MMLTSIAQKQTLKQMPLAMFKYEIVEAGGRYLNLYDRTNSEQGENILRFLVQVPIDENCTTEGSVKQAVNKVYEKMGATTPPIMRIKVEGLSCLESFDYLR